MSSTKTQRPRARRSIGSLILGFFGEVFMTLGVLLLLYVVWELWWTNFEAQKAQNQALGELFSETPTPGPSTDESAPEELGNLQLGEGQVFGVMYSPRLGEDYAVPIAEGTSMDVLNTTGLGRYEMSQFPGELGNFAVAGHRQTHGAVLWDMDKFVNGDKIYVQTLDGYYTYEVVQLKIVDPHESEVILPNPLDFYAPPEKSMLTLTTCHPPYTTLERMITHAELVDMRPASEGPPPEIEEIVKKTVDSAQTGA